MKKVAFLVLALGLMLSSASNASAFSLAGGYTGPIYFKFGDFTTGSLYNESSGGYGQADGQEDAFGVFKVTSVHALGTDQTLWFDGKDGEELTGIFYGLDDDFWSVSPDGKVNIQSVGGEFAVYLDNTPDYNPTPGPGARVGNTYPTVTDGSLFLTMAMGSGVKFGDGNLTNDYIVYDNDLDSTTDPFTGDGTFYLDVNGGDYAWMFDTNSRCVTSEATGVTHCRDFFGQFDTTTTDSGAWLVRSNDPILGTAAPIPEPTSMMLLGSGLFGLIGSKLRKKRA
jgi:hypothetical protein